MSSRGLVKRLEADGVTKAKQHTGTENRALPLSNAFRRNGYGVRDIDFYSDDFIFEHTRADDDGAVRSAGYRRGIDRRRTADHEDEVAIQNAKLMGKRAAFVVLTGPDCDHLDVLAVRRADKPGQWKIMTEAEFFSILKLQRGRPR